MNLDVYDVKVDFHFMPSCPLCDERIGVNEQLAIINCENEVVALAHLKCTKIKVAHDEAAR